MTEAMPARLAVALLLLVGLAHEAKAQLREGNASMSALGKADAVRSSGFANEALYFNPAGMSQVQMYSIEGGYTYMHEVAGHYADASIVDSVTNQYIAAGLAYAYLDTNQPGDFSVGGSDTRIAHQLRGALSSGYRGADFSAFVGVGIRWMNLSLGDRGAVDPVTMDVGALLIIKSAFRVGIVGHNLIEHKGERNELPRQLGVGASFFSGGFLAGFDTVVDFDTAGETRSIYSLGLEYDVANMLPIRAGYQYTDILERHRITVGLGYYSQVFGVDIGYMQDVSSEEKTDATVGVDLRFFLP